MPIARPVLGQAVVPSQRPGDAEVGHQGGAVAGEEDVLRLDVPVDDAVLVGVVECAGCFA